MEDYKNNTPFGIDCTTHYSQCKLMKKRFWDAIRPQGNPNTPKSCSDIMAKLQGYEVTVIDGRIDKLIEQIQKGKRHITKHLKI